MKMKYHSSKLVYIYRFIVDRELTDEEIATILEIDAVVDVNYFTGGCENGLLCLAIYTELVGFEHLFGDFLRQPTSDVLDELKGAIEELMLEDIGFFPDELAVEVMLPVRCDVCDCIFKNDEVKCRDCGASRPDR